MNKDTFGKNMENVKNSEIWKFITKERRKNYLVSEPNCHTTEFFTEYLLPIDMKKAQILMNKTVYLVLSILELNKIAMDEVWYDYVQLK